MHDPKMQDIGFSRDEDGRTDAIHCMRWDNMYDSTMIVTVDIVNKKIKWYLENKNNCNDNNNATNDSSIQTTNKTGILKENMIYIFTLDIRGCICKNEKDKGCSFRLKVEQN